MIKYVLPLLMVASVTACESSLDVSTSPVQINYAQPAAPASVTMLPVNWTLVTKDNIDTFIAQAKASNTTAGPIFVSITTGDYQNMILNIADLRRYIEQQQAIIVYYKNITTNTPPASK